MPSNIGDKLQVQQFDDFSNTFTLIHNNEELLVSLEIAKQLYVEKLN